MPAAALSEPLLLTGASMDAPALCRAGTAEVAWFVRPCADEAGAADEGVRTNEDAIFIHEAAPGRLIAAVADGAGGRPGGTEAARLTLETLRDALLAAEPDPIDHLAPILRGIEEAHGRVQMVGGGAATTLCLAELNGNWLRTYNVGDSGALLCGQRGRIGLQTLMHSPTGYALEAGLLDESEALRHDERHVVSNLVGAGEMHIQVSHPVRMRARDTLLIASDGVFDNLLTREIVQRIRVGSLAVAATALTEAVQRRMNEPRAGGISKPDDCAFVLLRLTDTGRRTV